MQREHWRVYRISGGVVLALSKPEEQIAPTLLVHCYVSRVLPEVCWPFTFLVRKNKENKISPVLFCFVLFFLKHTNTTITQQCLQNQEGMLWGSLQGKKHANMQGQKWPKGKRWWTLCSPFWLQQSKKMRKQYTNTLHPPVLPFNLKKKRRMEKGMEEEIKEWRRDGVGPNDAKSQRTQGHDQEISGFRTRVNLKLKENINVVHTQHVCKHNFSFIWFGEMHYTFWRRPAPVVLFLTTNNNNKC